MTKDWRDFSSHATKAGALVEEVAVQGFISVARIEGQFHLLAVLGKAGAVGMALILPVGQQPTAHIIVPPHPLPVLKASDVVVIGVGPPDGIGGVVFHGVSLAGPRVLPSLNVQYHVVRLGGVLGLGGRPDRVTQLRGARFVL